MRLTLGAEQAVAGLKRLGKGSSSAADALRKTDRAMRDLKAQAKALGEFERQRDRLDNASQQLDQAKALGLTGKAMKSLSADYEKQLSLVKRLNGEMYGKGWTDSKVSQEQLAASIAATNAQLLAQRQRLERLAKLRTSTQGMAMKGAAVTGAGYGTQLAGRSMLRGAGTVLSEGKHYAQTALQIQSLNLGEQATQDSIRYAKAMKTYGTSTAENMGLMKDALTAFADTHHAKMVMGTLAKMKFANEAMYGEAEGSDNERKFLDMLRVIEMRGGLSSEAAFKNQADVVQRVLTATGGRVGPNEWLDVIKTGGVAAKGIKDEAFYYQLEPLVQEMGGFRVGTAMMSAYQNLYQGKTTKRSAMMLDSLGLIADKSKVKHDKVGQIAQLGVGAIKGSDLFQQDQFGWLEKVLLPALAEKGITGDKQVLDAMGGIFSNRTASNLFATMYQQRDQIHKNTRLNAGAMGIDQLNGLAMQSPRGKEIELEKKRADLYQKISDRVMPTYVKVLEKAAGALEALNGFAERNPALVKGMAVGFGALAVGAVALGTLAIPLGIVLAKMALLRYLIGANAGAFAILGRGAAWAWGLLAGGAMNVLRILGAVGRLALMALATPMGAALALLGAAAYMVWRNWDGIKGGLSIIWQQITDGVGSAWQTIVGFKTRFITAGAELIRGVATGITSGLGAVRDAVLNAGSAAVGWFKEKLGIHSPSRVFMALGQNIPEGAALGIQRGSSLLRGAALAMATVPLTAAAGMGGGPLMASGAGGGASVGGSSYQITINAPAGADPQAIARAVSAELDRREGRQRRAVLSQMADIDG